MTKDIRLTIDPESCAAILSLLRHQRNQSRGIHADPSSVMFTATAPLSGEMVREMREAGAIRIPYKAQDLPFVCV